MIEQFLKLSLIHMFVGVGVTFLGALGSPASSTRDGIQLKSV